MTSRGLDRRGFLARGAAFIAGLIGASAIGGISVRSWARPLQLAPLKRGSLPKVKTPQAFVRVGLDEALAREREASRLNEFRILADRLTAVGYERSGVMATNGVDGYAQEGSRSCVVEYSQGRGEVTAIIKTTWLDRNASQFDCAAAPSTSVVAVEVLPPQGDKAVLRVSYLENGEVATVRVVSGDVPNPCENSADCHAHPPGTCPCGTSTCLHCSVPTNLCQSCNIDDSCLAGAVGTCTFISSRIPVTAVAAIVFGTCMVSAYEACTTCSGWYCCDFVNAYCCAGGPKWCEGPGETCCYYEQ